MRNLICLMAVLFLLCSCTHGGKISSQMINNDLIIGESNKNDVLTLCGEPQCKRRDSQGSDVWHYAYVNKGVTAAGVFGHIAGIGVETKSHRFVFEPIFKNNIMVDYRLDESNTKHFSFQ